MYMSGGNQLVKVVLRNPLNYADQIDYVIKPADNELAHDWIAALKNTLNHNLLLEKNYCFMGFPKTARTLEYLCSDLNKRIKIINDYFRFFLNLNMKSHLVFFLHFKEI